MSKESLKTRVGLRLSFREMSSAPASRLVLRTLNLAMPFAWTDFSHLGFSSTVSSSERPSLTCVFIIDHLHPSHSQSTQCPALCDSTYYSPPGSSVHGIPRARIVEWLPFLPLWDFPDPGIEPESRALLDCEPPLFQFYFHGGYYEYWKWPCLFYNPLLHYDVSSMGSRVSVWFITLFPGPRPGPDMWEVLNTYLLK